MRYTVGVLTENYEEKMDIESLWPWPLTIGHQFQLGMSQCCKQPFRKNRVQIDVYVRLEFFFTSRAGHTDIQTDRHTHTHTHTHRHTDTQTNCSENITPPRFRGGEKRKLPHRHRSFFWCPLKQF